MTPSRALGRAGRRPTALGVVLLVLLLAVVVWARPAWAAPSVSVLTEGTFTGATGSITTANVNPNAACLQVLIVTHKAGGAGVPNLAASGVSGTWTRFLWEQGAGTDSLTVAAFRTRQDDLSAGTVSVTGGAAVASTDWSWKWLQACGVPGGANGSNAIAGSVLSGVSGTATTWSSTLAGAPAVTSTGIGGCVQNGGSATLTASGFTAIGTQQGTSSDAVFQTFYDDTSPANAITCTGTSTNTRKVAIYLEVAAAAASDACSWEHGGVVESDPEPCPDPVAVDCTSGCEAGEVTFPDGEALEVTSTALEYPITLGLGLLIFLLAIRVIHAWARR